LTGPTAARASVRAPNAPGARLEVLLAHGVDAARASPGAAAGLFQRSIVRTGLPSEHLRPAVAALSTCRPESCDGTDGNRRRGCCRSDRTRSPRAVLSPDKLFEELVDPASRLPDRGLDLVGRSVHGHASLLRRRSTRPMTAKRAARPIGLLASRQLRRTSMRATPLRSTTVAANAATESFMSLGNAEPFLRARSRCVVASARLAMMSPARIVLRHSD
jgi:hypothetical protein